MARLDIFWKTVLLARYLQYPRADLNISSSFSSFNGLAEWFGQPIVFFPWPSQFAP